MTPEYQPLIDITICAVGFIVCWATLQLAARHDRRGRQR
jgi:hypothetical protein